MNVLELLQEKKEKPKFSQEKTLIIVKRDLHTKLKELKVRGAFKTFNDLISSLAEKEKTDAV